MIFRLFSRICGLLHRRQVLFTHGIHVISIGAILFVPANLVSAPSIPPSFPPGWMAHNPIIVRTSPMNAGISPFVISGPYPTQIRKAYGIDKLGNDGAGKTIAIVDAYGDPNIATDLSTFNSQFGLPSANLISPIPRGFRNKF